MVFFSLLPYTTIFDAIPKPPKMRFSVRGCRAQNALFREGDDPECVFP